MEERCVGNGGLLCGGSVSPARRSRLRLTKKTLNKFPAFLNDVRHTSHIERGAYLGSQVLRQRPLMPLRSRPMRPLSSCVARPQGRQTRRRPRWGFRKACRPGERCTTGARFCISSVEPPNAATAGNPPPITLPRCVIRSGRTPSSPSTVLDRLTRETGHHLIRDETRRTVLCERGQPESVENRRHHLDTPGERLRVAWCGLADHGSDLVAVPLAKAARTAVRSL